MYKPYSLRLRIILFNVSIILLSVFFLLAVLLVSISYILSSYIRADIDFFLMQTGNNFETKTLLMEDRLLEIRANSVLMEYLLAVKNEKNAKINHEYITTQFKKLMNLYSNKNQDIISSPFITSVYLFNSKGGVLSTHYYQYLQSEEKLFLQKYTRLYEQVCQTKKDTAFFFDEKTITVVFPVYTNFMEDVGTIMFVIDINSVYALMENVSNYNKSFWILFDKYKYILAGKNAHMLSDNLYTQITSEYKKGTYEKLVDATPYVVYSRQMNMGLHISIGIPRNQLFILLFDAIKLYILLTILLSSIIVILSFIIIYRITAPLNEIAKKIILVGEGNYDVKLPNYNSSEFLEISNVFNTMTSRIKYLITDVYQKQILLKESELKFLQSQMNPHFLFNILNTIALKAKFTGDEDVYKMITSFAQLTQASIYRKNTEKITIRQEMELVEFYLYLQASRYGEKLQYVIHIDNKNLLTYYIPKLCIQLIVENAVVHGIEPMGENGIIDISINEKDKNIYITIQDNGVGFNSESHNISFPIPQNEQTSIHNSVALNNMHKLIQFFYGEEYGLHIMSEKNKGTTVTITIPFDSEEKSHV